MRFQYLILIVLFFAACASSRKTSNTETEITDSVTKRTDTRTSSVSNTEKTTVLKDSTIGIAPVKVEDIVTPITTPCDSTKRVMKPGTYWKKEKGVMAYATITEDGKLIFGAITDSLTMVVRNLQRESTYKSEQYDSLAAAYESKSHAKTVYITKTVTKTKTLFGYLWPWLLLLAVGGLAWFLIKKYLL